MLLEFMQACGLVKGNCFAANVITRSWRHYKGKRVKQRTGPVNATRSLCALVRTSVLFVVLWPCLRAGNIQSWKETARRKALYRFPLPCIPWIFWEHILCKSTPVWLINKHWTCSTNCEVFLGVKMNLGWTKMNYGIENDGIVDMIQETA